MPMFLSYFSCMCKWPKCDIRDLNYATTINVDSPRRQRWQPEVDLENGQYGNSATYCSFSYYLYIRISSFTSLSPKRIVLDCFYLLIFHFETDLQLVSAVCRLLYT